MASLFQAFNNKPARGELTNAATTGDIEAVKDLLDRGADINENFPRSLGRTPLIGAVFNGHIDIVTLLLEKGALPDNKDGQSGETALIVAAQRGRLELITLLLEKGASIDQQDATGYTALMYAALRNDSQEARFLISNGALLNVRDKTGMTVLMIAKSFKTLSDVAQVLGEAHATQKKNVLKVAVCLQHNLRTKPSPFKKQICRK